MKKTHAQFVEELGKVNQNIEVVGTYISARSPILVKCKIDSYEWTSTPDNLLRSKGCMMCARKANSNSKKKNFKEIEKVFANRHLRLLTTENEVNLLSQDRLRYLCPVHGEQTILWGNFIKGAGCRKCADEENSLRMRKDTWNRIEAAFLASEYKLVSTFDEYVGAKESCLRCVCQKHGEFRISWNNFNSGEGCPVCNSSAGERRILRYLLESNIQYEQPKRFDDLLGVGGKRLSYDFYVPQEKLLIEYQGQQHAAPAFFGDISYDEAERNFKRQQEHDLRKKNYALSHGYRLLEIWYYEFNEINDILERHLIIQN